LRDLRKLFEQDWDNIQAGQYRMPHDLLSQPLRGLGLAPRYIEDMRRVERRRLDRQVKDLPEAPDGRYPAYYLQNFHYQSDGYLSRESAKLYDHQVEVIFGGGADAMRRQALVPLGSFLKGRRQAATRFADIACGTGRFLSFVKDNYPRLPVTALDLSPDYLAEARETLKPWRGADFVAAPAEATGLPGASFDAMTCIYLLHEIPPKVRVQVARELSRLLAPGGILVVIDSLQTGDNPDYDGLLEFFPAAFHEPYFASYLETDLVALFAEAGLETASVETAYLSRVMTLRKPR
ncbi:MAG: class I SAM-dependent methyltransferase, partial [Rhodovibrionaceae bacterium]